MHLFIDSDAPPIPPLPAEYGGGNTRAGHLDTTTDDEAEEMFHKAPTPSQGPIMVGGFYFILWISIYFFISKNLSN